MPSPNHCIYSQISPWMCGFLMAFLISIPVPITSLSKLALKKNQKFSFSFSSESLYLILSETLWLILFSLLSPLVHKASMKGLSSKTLRVRSGCVVMCKSFCSNRALLVEVVVLFILLGHSLGIMSGFFVHFALKLSWGSKSQIAFSFLTRFSISISP